MTFTEASRLPVTFRHGSIERAIAERLLTSSPRVREELGYVAFIALVEDAALAAKEHFKKNNSTSEMLNEMDFSLRQVEEAADAIADIKRSLRDSREIARKIHG